LADGRYPLRRTGAEGLDATGVLVVQTAGAPPAARGRLRRRPRPREAPPGEETTPVPVTRLTVISASELEDGEAWLDAVSGNSDRLEDEVQAGLATANRALHAHAVGTQDPALGQISRSDPLAVRVGYGSGEALADGRWTRAVDVPHATRRARRAEALRPAERVAAVLGGHERPDACETLLLRARSDLDAGRGREAALQLRVGLDALLAEVAESPGPDQADDLAELEARRSTAVQVAGRALRDDLEPEQLAELEATLAICERVLRRRRILGATEDAGQS
jgi:hypothetical protein